MSAGVMDDQPTAWLSYALALQGLHEGGDDSQTQHAIEQGLFASPNPQAGSFFFLSPHFHHPPGVDARRCHRTIVYCLSGLVVFKGC